MDKLLFGRRILVVEDETILLMTIEDMMADLGCKSVTSASTIDKAVSLATNGQVFDAAILDINLNGYTGRPVVDALVARGVPFIVCTGNRGDVGMISPPPPSFRSRTRTTDWTSTGLLPRRSSDNEMGKASQTPRTRIDTRSDYILNGPW